MGFNLRLNIRMDFLMRLNLCDVITLIRDLLITNHSVKNIPKPEQEQVLSAFMSLVVNNAALEFSGRWNLLSIIRKSIESSGMSDWNTCARVAALGVGPTR